MQKQTPIRTSPAVRFGIIQLFYSALNPKGRAGFVMANSASDARSSEQEIRKQLIEARAVDAQQHGSRVTLSFQFEESMIHYSHAAC